jgi:predicted lactoylglutathione lyase
MKEDGMSRMIFVNLPVRDLGRSVGFYQSVGAVQNEQFSDASASMVSFSSEINVMLLTHERFRSFTTKAIADTRTSAQALLCLSADSREAVDRMVEDAAAAGAAIDPTPTQDYGFMYGRSFEDPDGHIWEVMWMDVEAASKAMAPQAETADA